jgi:two-component system response regulator TctD
MRMPGWRTMPTHNAVNVMKLLLVEDNEQLAHWLAKILEDDGFVLDRVSDGDAADRFLRTTRYDVVLLDLNLPNLSGKGVLRRLRERGDDTPVLILTASGSVDEKVSWSRGSRYWCGGSCPRAQTARAAATFPTISTGGNFR